MGQPCLPALLLSDCRKSYHLGRRIFICNLLSSRPMLHMVGLVTTLKGQMAIMSCTHDGCNGQPFPACSVAMIVACLLALAMTPTPALTSESGRLRPSISRLCEKPCRLVTQCCRTSTPWQDKALTPGLAPSARCTTSTRSWTVHTLVMPPEM